MRKFVTASVRQCVSASVLYCLIVAVLFFAAGGALAIVDGPPTPEPPYAVNQLIVKYKTNQSPEELQALVARREIKRENFLGFLGLFWEELIFRLRKIELPQKQLERLQRADQEVGVVEKEKLFQSEEASLENFYLIKTDGRLPVPKAVELYQNLPEVEFAEPNYIYSIMGI